MTAEISNTRASWDLQRGDNIPIGLDRDQARAIRASFRRTSRAIEPASNARGCGLPANQDRLVADAEENDAVIVDGTVIRHENEDQVAADASLPSKLLRDGRAS
jgi:hypothetical protein